MKITKKILLHYTTITTHTINTTGYIIKLTKYKNNTLEPINKNNITIDNQNIENTFLTKNPFIQNEEMKNTLDFTKYISQEYKDSNINIKDNIIESILNNNEPIDIGIECGFDPSENNNTKNNNHKSSPSYQEWWEYLETRHPYLYILYKIYWWLKYYYNLIYNWGYYKFQKCYS